MRLSAIGYRSIGYRQDAQSKRSTGMSYVRSAAKAAKASEGRALPRLKLVGFTPYLYKSNGAAWRYRHMKQAHRAKQRRRTQQPTASQSAWRQRSVTVGVVQHPTTGHYQVW